MANPSALTLVILIIMIVVFIVIRTFWLWYWNLDKIESNGAKLLQLSEKQLAATEKTNALLQQILNGNATEQTVYQRPQPQPVVKQRYD